MFLIWTRVIINITAFLTNEEEGGWSLKGTGKKGMATIIFMCVIFCFSITAQASSNLLRLGSRGEEVKKLQQALIEAGFLEEGEADGIFGPKTKNAVIEFQMVHGIQQDGIAGPVTLSLLFKSQPGEDPLQGEKGIEEEEVIETIEEIEEETGDVEGKKESEQVALDRGSGDRDIAAALIDFALQYLGKPYAYSAAGPDAFDCSGFTTYVYKNFGISLPRSAKDQGYGEYAPKIGRDELQPGDLVFFNTNSGDDDLSDHAGIYIGDGKFIHASSSETNGRKVIISSMDSGYYQRVFSWGRRVLK